MSYQQQQQQQGQYYQQQERYNGGRQRQQQQQQQGQYQQQYYQQDPPPMQQQQVVYTNYVAQPEMGEVITLPRPSAYALQQQSPPPPPPLQDEYYVPYSSSSDPYSSQQQQLQIPQQQYYNGGGGQMYEDRLGSAGLVHRTPSPVNSTSPLYMKNGTMNGAGSGDGLDALGRDSSSKPRQNRCMYLCIPVNKRHRTICLSIVALLLIGLGIFGYFFFPKNPTFQIMGISPANTNAYTLTGFNQSNPSQLVFTMDMIMTISVLNINPYHLKVDTMTLSISVDANGTEINAAEPVTAYNFFGGAALIEPRPWVTNSNFRNQIANGTHSAITFPSNTNITFQMPLKVNYSPSLGLYDPTLNEIIQVCSYDYAQQQANSKTPLTRVMDIHYDMQNSIGILQYIGFTPSVSGTTHINCPFQGTDLDTFMTKLKGTAGH